MAAIWATERGALASDLADLTPAQWDKASLCAGWTVRDIVAHLSATASLNPATFFVGMARAGFRLRQVRQWTDRQAPWRRSGRHPGRIPRTAQFHLRTA